MRVAMFVYNSFTADARVAKEATTLAHAGHEVTVFAVKDNATPAHEDRDGYRIVRIWRDPLHYRLLRGGRSFRRTVRLTASRTRRLPRRTMRLALRLLLPGPIE